MTDLKALLIRLDRVNRELETVKSPEYIEKKTAEIFPAEMTDSIKTVIAKGINEILQEVKR